MEREIEKVSSALFYGAEGAKTEERGREDGRLAFLYFKEKSRGTDPFLPWDMIGRFLNAHQEGRIDYEGLPHVRSTYKMSREAFVAFMNAFIELYRRESR